MMSGATDSRERILEATRTCFERDGIARTSIEDVAVEAGLSRATVYRTFPGGRDQLVSETITWEVGNFLVGLGAAVAEDRDLQTILRHALMVGHRTIAEHRLLQQLLSTEREALFRGLVETEPIMHAVLRDFVAAQLEHERVRPGVDPAEAADYIARIFISYVGSPGRWDLDDEEVVDRLVRDTFVAGVLDSPST